METFGSSDSDSVELMTPLTTPIFDFHLVISSLMIPTPEGEVGGYSL